MVASHFGCKLNPIMIRPCGEKDIEAIYFLINDAAQAYRGVIPADCWKQPYMSLDEVLREIRRGVNFWGCQEGKKLVGIMGVQSVEDVTLIRHAYVMTSKQNQGIGHKLLLKLIKNSTNMQLIGTWAAAFWAVRFYQRHGFSLVPVSENERLLKRYWNIPDRQMKASVVLVDGRHVDAIAQTAG